MDVSVQLLATVAVKPADRDLIRIKLETGRAPTAGLDALGKR
jgi:hypothetical protein